MSNHPELPLTQKLTPLQAERRGQRIAARLTRWERLSREHAITRGLVIRTYQILGRRLLGRLKWLIIGR